ncbi:nucleotide sugar dehydrogenase, partial [Paracoccaceae bacterium]|nr:nucleotide sugar dehydrogenase [Paracoccaceae bacterium]
MKLGITDPRIAIIGLGYVGLPLAAETSKHYEVIGYDISQNRISELKSGFDRTLEISNIQLADSENLKFSDNLADIEECNVYIITVPTPIDINNNPDLSPLINASSKVGSILKHGNVVIYESTVYPGATEELCVPILEEFSGLKFNCDFFCGYSPERINPGDKVRGITDVVKVTSGSTKETVDFVDDLYAKVIQAGTYKAPSIRVAEAAKVIENTQRDVNVALVNELSMIFNKMDIDTVEVLKAAGTKWNFMPFRPGLVGGHCIGVDPYYLTYKAQSIGYDPKMILSGREINNNMGRYVADCLIRKMIKERIQLVDANVLILGFTFKENCPDVRNTRVVDIVDELKDLGIKVDIYDPWA